MTPDEFIAELLGEGWTQDMLPTLLSHVVRWSVDAQRYYVVRDAFEIEPANGLKSKRKLALFDKQVDDLYESMDYKKTPST